MSSRRVLQRPCNDGQAHRAFQSRSRSQNSDRASSLAKLTVSSHLHAALLRNMHMPLRAARVTSDMRVGVATAAEKLVGEIDRQIRGVGNGVRHVVRRQTRDGSVQHEAGAGILAQAALGDDILGYTGTVAGRNTMNTGCYIISSELM